MQTERDIVDGEAIDALADAHTRTVDALAGFEKMVEKAEPEFRPVAERFRALHARHAAELAGLMAHHGRSPDRNGSFMSSVNRAVVATRAFFDEIDRDVMRQVRSGERNVLEAYDQAVLAMHEPDRTRIDTMRAELSGLIADTGHLD